MDADRKVRPEMQTKRRWMRSLLLWKRERILFLAAILAFRRARWISCWSRSSEVSEPDVKLLTGLVGAKNNKRSAFVYRPIANSNVDMVIKIIP